MIRTRYLLILVSLAAMAGCYIRDAWHSSIQPPRGVSPRNYRLLTTGYCPCGECCNWRRNWLFQPVIAKGQFAGNRKAVGVTASGSKAKYGTIAADTNLFPFGTILYIPDYGYGRVEDLGGAIKGYHIDLFFKDHEEAKEWGSRTKTVKVWLPSRRIPRR